MNTIFTILLIIIGFICFHLGEHWEAKTIHDNLKKYGQTTTRWGETERTVFKIIGTVEK